MSTLKANSYQHVDRGSPSIIINSDGSVSISSTVTYEDVTSVDAVGVITGRSNADLQNRVNVGSGVSIKAGGLNVTAGISTFGDDVSFTGAAANVTWDKSTDDLIFNDNAQAKFGTGGDLSIYHASNNSSIVNSNNSNYLYLKADNLSIAANSVGENYLVANVNAAVKLYHDGTQRLTTTTSGISISDELNVVGLTTIGGDVSIADKIIHTGDTNTAIRFPSADTITAETGGTERLRIDSSGTTTIAGELDLTGNCLTSFGANSSNEAACIKVGYEGSSKGQIRVYGADNSTTGSLEFKVCEGDGTDDHTMLFDSSGRLLVGSNTVYAHAAGDDLQVGITTGAHGIAIISGAWDNGEIHFGDGSGSGNANVKGQIVYSHSVDAMRFFTDVTERMRIDSSGRVMIGNTNAANLFSVANNLVVGSGSGSEGMTIYSDSSNDGYIVFADGASDPAYRMGQIIYSHNTNKMQFRTNGNTDRLTIDSAGDIEVGGNLKTNNLPGRNLLINGAMAVNQKNASSTSDGYQVADMWWWGAYGMDQAAITQANTTGDHPDGFDHSFKLTVGTAESSLDTNEWATLRTRIEGQNLQHLKTGTASAEKITLSFWAKTASANSGDQYSVTIIEGDISGNDRIQKRSFTPTSTWQRFTMTYDGQTNNAIRNDNDYGMTIYFVLVAASNKLDAADTTWELNTASQIAVTGQSNFFDNTSNEFYITGVQLEVGSIATEFEHRSYDDELARCMRYCEVMVKGNQKYMSNSVGYETDQLYAIMRFKVEKRTVPSLEHTSGTNYYQNWHNGTGTYFNGFSGVSWPNEWASGIYTTSAVSAKEAGLVGSSNASAQVIFTAEL